MEENNFFYMEEDGCYDYSYSNFNGLYQETFDKLIKKIPESGSVKGVEKNNQLENFRIAYNSYWDLYNNSFNCKKRDFSSKFKVKPSLFKSELFEFDYSQELFYFAEMIMDRFVISAGIEQKILKKENYDLYQQRGRKRVRKGKKSDLLIGTWVSKNIESYICFEEPDKSGVGRCYDNENFHKKYRVVQELDSGVEFVIELYNSKEESCGEQKFFISSDGLTIVTSDELELACDDIIKITIPYHYYNPDGSIDKNFLDMLRSGNKYLPEIVV